MKKRMLLPILLAALMTVSAFAADIKVTEQTTSIEADSVFNTEGYGSLTKEYPDDGEYRNHMVAQTALMDKTGKLVMPYSEGVGNFYVSGDTISRGTLLYADCGGNGDDEGYIMPRYYDLSGKERFNNITYRRGTPFVDGAAVVLGNSKNYVSESYGWYGTVENDSDLARIIDQNGKVLAELPAPYTEVIDDMGDTFNYYTYFAKGCGWPSEGLIASYMYEEDGYDLYPTLEGYLDYTGKLVLPLSGYTDSRPFYEGLAAVQSAETGEWGFIDKTGKLVIPCQYEASYSFKNGYAYAVKDGMYGLINTKNEVIVPFKYDAVYGAGDGVVTVGNGGKYGLIDLKGNAVTEMVYDDMSNPGGGVVYAIRNGKVSILTIGEAKDETPAPAPATDGKKTAFTDVPAGAWYEDAVAWATEKGVTKGTGDGTTFSPTKECTVAEILMLLWNMESSRGATAPATSPFTDVAAGVWYEKAAAWAAAQSLVEGDKLNPNALCTRGMAVEYFWKMAGKPQSVSDLVPFTDADRYSIPAGWAVTNGITSGTSATTFSPNKICTRAEIVRFLSVLYAD